MISIFFQKKRKKRVPLITFTVPSKLPVVLANVKPQKTNHQRILYKPFCSFLMEPVCASAYQSVISDRKWKLPKTLGKQGSQTIFNVTQRTKTSWVFRVRDLSTSNGAVSQQIPVILRSRLWWQYFIQWLWMDLTVVTGGQYHFLDHSRIYWMAMWWFYFLSSKKAKEGFVVVKPHFHSRTMTPHEALLSYLSTTRSISAC